MFLAEQPLLSVIVPVYNGAAYIDELVAQFVSQDMSKAELVFVDDGSTDDSYEKLLMWQRKASFAISVYHQTNQGVSAARNVGVEKAKGRYLTFVDVDDAVAQNYLSTLFVYLCNNLDVLVFDSQRVKSSNRKPEQSISFAKYSILTKCEMLQEFLNNPTRYGVYNLLLRKDYLKEYNITFPVGYKYYEDYDYLLQLFAQTDNIIRLQKVLYYYVLRESSAMSRFNADRINCLQLMKRRGTWMEQIVPEFTPAFERWGTSRLYWSVLWQAALAFSNYSEFVEFARITHAQCYLVKLKGYPDKFLQLSAKVFLFYKPVYYLAVRLIGRTKSRVQPIKLKDVLPYLKEDVAFY